MVEKSDEKTHISVSIKRDCWDKIQDLKAHPNQRNGEIIEELVDKEHKEKISKD